jgi:uncharacterized protein YqeY
MTIKERIKADILTATKARDNVTKNTLKVVLGEVDTQEGRGKTLTDEQVYGIVRKVLQGIEEMLTYKPGDTALLQEKTTLSKLLPAQLNRDDILDKLIDKVDEIVNAKADGQATGIAMKYFKENKLVVDGTLVADVIKQLRNP